MKLFLLAITMLFSLNIQAQTSSEHLKVSYTYNFIRSITWPNEQNLRSFSITLFGEDKKLENHFLKLARNEKVKDVRIIFKSTNRKEDLRQSHVIFIAQNKHNELPEIFEDYEGKPTLIVTYNFNNQRLVMINLQKKNDTMAFEINKANILNNNLQVNPDLILYGGTEIDVAKLYRKGQKSLSFLENRVRKQEKQLIKLKSEIDKSQALIKVHENELSTQENNIKIQSEKISQQSLKISLQRKALDNSKGSLEALQKEIASSRIELEEKTEKNKTLLKSLGKLKVEIEDSQKIIGIQDKELADKKLEEQKLINQIGKKSSSLTILQGKYNEAQGEVQKKHLEIKDIFKDIVNGKEKINEQLKQIEEQKEILESRGRTIATQKNVLQLLWFVVILITLLIVTMARAYFNKQKNNNELREREIALNEANNELEIAQVQLIDARNAALTASKTKSEFLANMSHEIRTPMNAILGFSDLLKKRVKDDKEKKFIRSIEASGRSLLRLINDILDLSKVEAGKIEVEYTSVNAMSLFKELKTVFATKISRKGLEFIIDIAPDLPNGLILDETRVRQILFNLIGNAIKFTSEGYIKISVSTKGMLPNSPLIDLVIKVEDSGIGVPDDQKNKIFGAFEQQSGQSNTKYGGTGLGLAISRKLIELMKGTLSIEDTPSGGATFIIELPEVEVTTISESSKSDLASNIHVDFKPATVLIADDIPLNRELLINYLSPQPIKIYEAENGQEAIDAAAQHNPDLILMDMKMPIMNGYDASASLKANNQLQHIPIIAITASAMKQSEQEILNTCDSYLRKPVDETGLFQEMTKFLEHSVSDDMPINPKEAPEDSIHLPEEIIIRLQPHINVLKDGLNTDSVSEMINILDEYSHMPQLKEIASQLQDHLNHFDLDEINKLLKKVAC